jgi:hypothetical protein
LEVNGVHAPLGVAITTSTKDTFTITITHRARRPPPRIPFWPIHKTFISCFHFESRTSSTCVSIAP